MPVSPPPQVPLSIPPPIGDRRAAAGDNLALWGMIAGLAGIVVAPMGGGMLLGPAGLVLAAMAQARPMKHKSRITMAVLLSIAALVVSAYISTGSISRIFSGGVNAWEGVRAPDFSLKTIDGETVKLSELRGKRVFVDVWATWCPPCRAMQPDLNRLAQEHATGGVEVIGLSADSAEDAVIEYAKRSPFAYPVGWMRPDFPGPYSDIDALPTLFVVDRNGVIIAVETGRHSYNALAALANVPDWPGTPRNPPGAIPGETGEAKNAASQ